MTAITCNNSIGYWCPENWAKPKPRQIGFKGEIGGNIGETMGIAKIKNSACIIRRWQALVDGWNITCCLLRHCLHMFAYQDVTTCANRFWTQCNLDRSGSLSRSSSPKKGIASNVVKTCWNYAINHPCLGMVYTSYLWWWLGDGLWHCFNHSNLKSPTASGVVLSKGSHGLAMNFLLWWVVINGNYLCILT